MKNSRRRCSAFSALVLLAGVTSGGCTGTNVGTQPSPSGDASTTPDPFDAATETADAPGFSYAKSYHAIWGASDDDIWAFGLSGGKIEDGGRVPPDRCTPDPMRIANVVRHFDGTTWSPRSLGSAGIILDAHGSTANDVWAVGMHRAVWRWDGQSWKQQDISAAAQHDGIVMGCPEVSLHGVWTRSHDDVWAVGYIHPSQAGPGLILHFDGASWTRFPVDAPDGFLAVWASAPDDVWATGSSGMAYHFNGTAWSRHSSATTFYLHAVWGSASNDVWAAGNGGALTHFDGKSWRAFPDAGTIGGDAALSGRHGADVWAAFIMPDGWDNHPDVRRLLHWDGAAWTEVEFTKDLHIADLWSSPSGQVWSAGTTLERIR
jgi:hypothetical protein